MKSDFMRDTLTFDLTTSVSEGGNKACISMPALVGSYVLSEPGLTQNLKDIEDSISHIREFLEKDRVPFFRSLLSSVSKFSYLYRFRRINYRVRQDLALFIHVARQATST